MAKEKVNRVLGRKRIDTTEDVREAVQAITNNEIRLGHINFNYDSLEIETSEKIKLVEIEKELLFHGQQLGKLSIEIGKSLYKAREIFIKSHSESFMEWYQALGLSKDQVSHFLNRYKLVLDYPEKSENIIKLTDKQIKEINNKNTPSDLKERVISGEVISAAEIKRMRENISTQDEKILENKIEEAEIVESLSKFLMGEQCILSSLKIAMEKIKNGSNTKENMEKLKKVQDILDSVE